MKIIENWENIKEFNESSKLPAGPQCCRITNVIDVADRNYLKVEFEIVKGDFTGYGKALFDKFGTWPNNCSLIRSYSDNAAGFFKAFITAVEKSNEGYKWNWDEKTLVGKFVIVNYQEEEYVCEGEIKTSVKPCEFRSIEAYKKGDVKIPAKKTLTEDEKAALKLSQAAHPAVVDDDLPF